MLTPFYYVKSKKLPQKFKERIMDYKEFKKIIMRANKQFKSNELDKLIRKINIAIEENKHVIHYEI